MSHFDELFASTQAAVESLHRGLRNIGDEETQLIALRSQMAKIKKIREEQLKKDGLINSLKERIAILEHSSVTSARQFNEVQEIMTERIHTLERYVAEKETVERQLRESVFVWEERWRGATLLEDELATERRRSMQMQTLYDKASDDLTALHATVKTDRQLTEHMKALFDSLREELAAKEAELDALRRKGAMTDAATFSDLTSTRRKLDEALQQLLESEETSKKYEKQLVLAHSETTILQEERRRLQKELATAHSALAEQQALAARGTLAEKAVAGGRAAMVSIADSLELMLVMMEARDDNGDVGGSSTADRAVAELQLRLRGLAHSAQQDTGGADQQRIVRLASQLTNMLLDYRQVSIEISGQLHAKTASAQTASAALQEVEDKFAGVLHDSFIADSTVSALVATLDRVGALGAEASSSSADGGQRGGSVGDAAGFKSQKREHLYRRLALGVEHLAAALPYRARFLALQVEHSDALARCQAAQDEAFLAVQVSTAEATRSSDAQQRDLQRQLAERDAQRAHEVDSLRAALRARGDQFAQAIVCLQSVVAAADELDEQATQLRQVGAVRGLLQRGYDILVRDIKTIAGTIEQRSDGADGADVGAQRLLARRAPRVSLKATALAVLAARRWGLVGEARRRRLQEAQQARSLLLQKVAMETSMETDSAHGGALFAEMWALPAVDSSALGLQYVRQMLAVKLGRPTGKTKTSSLLALLASGPSAVGLGKELFGQRELNVVHARMLELSAWQQRHDRAQAAWAAAEQQLADLREDHQRLHQELAEAQAAVRQAAQSAQAARSVAQAANAEVERLQTERLQVERLHAERLQEERLQEERARVERERVETQRVQTERVEVERLRVARRYEDSASEQDESLLALRESLYRPDRLDRPPAPARAASPQSATRGSARREAISRLEERRRQANEEIDATSKALEQAKASPRQRADTQTSGFGAWDDSGQMSMESSFGDWSFRRSFVKAEVGSTFDTPPRTREDRARTPSSTPARADASLNSSFQATPNSRESTSAKFLRINGSERAKSEQRDHELLEIYSDIGRLTGRLETRLRHSSAHSSPESSMHK